MASTSMNMQQANVKRTSSVKRFMALSGGSVSMPSTLPTHGQSTVASMSESTSPSGVHYARVPASHSRQVQSTSTSAPPSRFLITVLPPEQLPHDPPHPRTSTFCSGYGPPSKFRRGTLVPLHATLAGQLAAIAREYGLPSTGGLMLYLVELNQDQQSSFSDALIGGPRIGDEAWQLLWGQLFNPPPAQDDYEASLSEEDDQSYDQYASDMHNASIPVMPPLPPSLRSQQHHDRPADSSVVNNSSAARAQSPSEHHSDASSLADNSSALTSEELLGQNSLASSNTSHVFSPNSASMRQTKSSNTSLNHDHESSIPHSPHTRPYSSASRGRPRNHPRGHYRGPSNMNARSNTSRHSVRSNRSYSHSSAGLDGPIYGESVIVGKIEFDIDNRRGAGRWFDAWMSGASTEAPFSLDTARSSRFLAMRNPPPSDSNLGSLLRSRNLVSDIDMQSTASTDQHMSEFTRQSTPASAVTQPSPKHELAALVEESQTRSRSTTADSVYPVAEEHAQSDFRAIRASSVSSQISQPESLLREYTVKVEDASMRLPETEAVQEDKRMSQTSMGMLSPAPTPNSRRSSRDLPNSLGSSTNTPEGSQQLFSERSSTSSFGHEANIEAMNATPRVRSQQIFASPSRSSRTHSRALSELSTTSDSRQTPSDDSQESLQSASAASGSPKPAPMSPPKIPRAATPTLTASSVYDSHDHSPVQQHDGMVGRISPTSNFQRSVSRASSNASRQSHDSTLSMEAVSLEQHEYQTLDDEDTESVLSEARPNHAQEASTYVQEKEPDLEDRETTDEAFTPDFPQVDEADVTGSDPLKEVFPNDATTWAQFKYTHDLGEDSANDSPAEDVVQTALGLGISSAALLHGHTIPPSASSSLDPFEYDDETADTLNSPVGPPEDDVKEITDMLKAHPPASHIGLSSPINLGEPSKRFSAPPSEASRHSQDLLVDSTLPIESDRVRSVPAPQASNVSSPTHSRPSPTSSIDPALIALPESDSNLSLFSMAASSSSKSLASIASQPSIWEPDTTITDASKPKNRGARLPADWADQLYAIGDIRSRQNSIANEGNDLDQSASVPVGELPQFLQQLHDQPQSRASLASLYAQSARSRSSSIEMMDNLDEIERALAELSPRALKPFLSRQAVPMPRLGGNSSQSGNDSLNSLFDHDKRSPVDEDASQSPRNAEMSKMQDANDNADADQGDVTTTLPQAPSIEKEADATPDEIPASEPPSVRSSIADYMAPPLPLKIRTERQESRSSPVNASNEELPPLSYRTHYPEVSTPVTESMPQEQVTSPGGASLASTTIPYDLPSVHGSPQQRVTFAPSPEPVEQPNTPNAGKTGMSSKIAAGFKLNKWSGKNSVKESGSPGLQAKEASSPTHPEPMKSPLAGLKGFKWWQKEGPQQGDDTLLKTAAETSLPMSPGGLQQGEPTPILNKPTPSFSQTARIPRKSSLASLAATARGQDAYSPNMHNMYSMPLPAPSPSSMHSHNFTGEYPSPPTHTSLPSPQRMPARLPSFLPSYPPQFTINDEEQRDDTSAISAEPSSGTDGTDIGSTSQLYAGTAVAPAPAMATSASLPAFGSAIAEPRDNYAAYTHRTPEMGDQAVFLGHNGEGGTSSAPVTPVYAQPSLVSSSGRYGKPTKLNTAKANFRLSADSDLSKMMKHMEAIEFGEDGAQTQSSIVHPAEQGHIHPGRYGRAQNFGLGLGLPGARKTSR